MSAAPDVVAVVDRIYHRSPFAAVVASSESNVGFAALLRERYGLPGPTYSEALRGTNKWRMKRGLHGQLPTARAWLSGDYCRLAESELPAEVVVKPLAESACRGVRVATGAAAAAELATQPELLLVEERLPVQRELHCDGFVRDRRIRAIAVSQYDSPVLTVAGRTRASTTLPASHPATAPSVAFAERVVEQLAVTDAVFHLELFVVDGELVFNEVGLRPGGGGCAASLRHAFGLDLWDEFVRLQLGLAAGRTDGPVLLSDGRFHGVVKVAAHGLPAHPVAARLGAIRGVTAVDRVPAGRLVAPVDSCDFTHLAFFTCDSAADARHILQEARCDAG